MTSAAAVMIAVFAVFATLSNIDFKMMCVGLATAVLIDATIVRESRSQQRCGCSATGTGTCKRG